MTKPTIVFLTYRWTEVTDYIRLGKSPAGTASVAKTWEQFARRGWDVHVVVLFDDPCPEKPRRTVELNGVNFSWLQITGKALRAWCRQHRIPLAHWLCAPLDWAKMWWTVRRNLPTADVYYSMRHSCGILAWALARLGSAKCVVRYYGNFVYAAWRNRSLLQLAENAPCVLLMKWPVDLHIVTRDGSYGARVFRGLRVKKHRWRVWLNGVDKDLRFEQPDLPGIRRRLRLPETDNILLTISRLSTTKRQDRVIRALPRIIAEFPATRYLLIGDGVRKDALVALARDLNLSQHVMFLGAIPNRELRDYLNAADIFFQPNDHSSLSTTLIEALTAGCCCVVRDAGEVSDIVENGNNAILLNPGESDDIAETTLRLLRNPHERRAFQQRAYDDAMQRFQTWDERLDMEVDELTKLIRQKPNRLRMSVSQNPAVSSPLPGNALTADVARGNDDRGFPTVVRHAIIERPRGASEAS